MIHRPSVPGSFDFPTMVLQLPDHEAVAPYLRQIDANRWYSNFGPLAGSLVSRLEQHLSAPTGSVGLMANATLALALILREAAERKPGGVCLLPSWTFAASAHAVMLSGLKPMFVDVDEQSGQLTVASVEAVMNKDVAAVMAVSAFGRPLDPAPWEQFQGAAACRVVIDAAAAFDTVQTSSVVTVVSMHATKPVACGEGAFVLSTDTALIEQLRRRSNFGFDPHRNSQMTGLNAKMSEYHAAVAHASLDQWPDMRARLVAAGRLYRKRLASAPDITTQQGWAETWISTTLNVRLARPPGLSALIARLAEAGIEARSWWGRGCHAQPAFSACQSGPLPVTEDIARRTIGLPFSHELCEADVDRIIGELERAIRDL